MTDYHDAAHAASLVSINCSAASISERARAIGGEHKPDGGYHAGRVDSDFRRLAAALGYTVEKAEPEPDTEANVRAAMDTATSLADDFATLTNAQIRALAKEVAG